jgi:hypothetical protein
MGRCKSQMGERSADYEPNGGGMGSSEEKQSPEQSPKMSSGFQCFVCGKQFGTNEERIEHLEEAAHGSMYDTASPQEREDTRRLQ